MFVIKFMSLDVEHKHTNKLKKTKNYFYLKFASY